MIYQSNHKDEKPRWGQFLDLIEKVYTYEYAIAERNGKVFQRKHLHFYNILVPMLFLISSPENIQFAIFFYFTELIHGKKHLPREDETEQKLARIDNFNDVTDKPTEEKNEMSEIESAMKDCRINMEENLSPTLKRNILKYIKIKKSF